MANRKKKHIKTRPNKPDYPSRFMDWMTPHQTLPLKKSRRKEQIVFLRSKFPYFFNIISDKNFCNKKVMAQETIIIKKIYVT